MCIATSSVVSGMNASDYSEAAIRQLKSATTIQRNGQHLLSLAALRTLRDSDLRPLFHKFTQHSEWAVQVHAVLGLAELSDEQSIDPWLVQQIAPSAREHVIAQALDDGLIHREQIETLLKWPLLETSPRLLLLADLQMLGGTPDIESLKELSNNTDLTVAMFASLLCGDKETIRKTTQALRRATKSNRNKALYRTLKLIQQYNLVSASQWLQELLEKNKIALSENERYWTLFTLLTIDNIEGLRIWNRSFPINPNRKDQVKNLLLLLESSINPTPEHVARLAVNEDDSLLDIMIRAGKVNDKTTSVGHEEIKALVELVERGHLASTEWAFRVASKQLTEELASSFYKALAVVPEKTSAWRNDVAIQAFGNLINLSPDDAWEILQSTKDDSNQQQLLLLAMLQVSNDVVVEEATKLRRIGLNKADVMTLLLIARDANQLQKEDQKHLGIIAAGGGHLSPAFETQAAWLYLKRIGLSEQALAAVGTQ
jgi:hypothetical protein